MNVSLDAPLGSQSTEPSACKSIILVNRDRASIDIARLPKSTGCMAVCITVYNEPAEALCNSLEGLGKSIRYLRKTYFDLDVHVTVVLDGFSKSSPSMKALLERLAGSIEPFQRWNRGLACFRQTISFGELSIFDSPLQGEFCSDFRWSKSLPEPQATPDNTLHEYQPSDAVELLIATKGENCGKLDSHWWFYRVICPHLEPAYCVQMDVGTVPEEKALHAFVTAFQKDARTGAVASSILPTCPTSSLDLLQCWQYLSFANSVLLEWPAESAAGYLSVVPGQLSAFRWAAIQDRDDCEAHVGSTAPLDVYFKGLGALTPYESMLYLAEDRVLCREIVSHPSTEWTIVHADDAVAITDSCHSWEELLRQRKRWCNGYMACRINYIRKLPRLLGNPEVVLRRKMQAATASLSHMAILANDWFLPSISLLLLYFLSTSSIALLSQFPTMQGVFKVLGCATGCAIFAQFIACLRGRLSSGNIRLFRFSIAIQGGLLAASILVNVVLGDALFLTLLLCFILVVWPIASLIGHRQFTVAIAKSTPIVFLTTNIVTTLMWMYAICNVHDNSWGTKGLISDPSAAPDSLSQTTLLRRKFLAFRTLYVSLWLGTNLIAAWLFSRIFGASPPDAAAALLAITAVPMLFGLACRVYSKASPSWSRMSRMRRGTGRATA